MERTVPRTATDEIELFLRTYYSLLRSTAEVQIRTLEEVHAGMNSLLHPGARDPAPDMAAFIYVLLRLPPCMPHINLVVLGQSSDVFNKSGFDNQRQWLPVSAQARRRRCFWDQQTTLLCYIASRSDIDDVIPMLTAFQIEWNKLHYSLAHWSNDDQLACAEDQPQAFEHLAQVLDISQEDLFRLRQIWGEAFSENLKQVKSRPCALSVRLLSGSLSEYRRATHSWWDLIRQAVPEIEDKPVYFVSSNTHSMLNLVGGYALQLEETLVDFINDHHDDNLAEEWAKLQSSKVPSSRENFLYYVLKKYQNTPEGKWSNPDQARLETAIRIHRIPNELCFELEAQIVELSSLKAEWFDPRLGASVQGSVLESSDALILNVDYPLGVGAFNILSEVAESVSTVLGVYVMGKSATLNGVIGDVVIPSVVHDEHSQNTYLFANCFSAADVAPYLVYGTVLDNQKSVTVLGTFLQNVRYMDVFYREGYTDIEMEAGPYLSAVYEMHRPKRHPVNEIVNLYGLPFDLGILHYASDTPLGKGKNLGAGSLSYFGMDSTYAVTLAILRRIFQREQQRLLAVQGESKALR